MNVGNWQVIYLLLTLNVMHLNACLLFLKAVKKNKGHDLIIQSALSCLSHIVLKLGFSEEI